MHLITMDIFFPVLIKTQCFFCFVWSILLFIRIVCDLIRTSNEWICSKTRIVFLLGFHKCCKLYQYSQPQWFHFISLQHKNYWVWTIKLSLLVICEGWLRNWIRFTGDCLSSVAHTNLKQFNFKLAVLKFNYFAPNWL